jgi:hypothetical protein
MWLLRMAFGYLQQQPKQHCQQVALRVEHGADVTDAMAFAGEDPVQSSVRAGIERESVCVCVYILQLVRNLALNQRIDQRRSIEEMNTVQQSEVVVCQCLALLPATAIA